MKSRRRVILGGILAIAACSSSSAVPQMVLDRAIYELRCPADRLTFTELSSATYGVDGCGKRVVYMRDGYTGAWALNSAKLLEGPGEPPTTSAGEAGPPKATPSRAEAPTGRPPG